ncbi:uncharacterized protein LOC109948691 [Prunus persica]|uniref:uncharacterized protein LOC109948691 n=1 Tax=Prunus persica TaxID=3760 RepID=UPI0009ABA8B7|nr:uncharacterized protein LOC109948691 [Prunus persica]
MPTEDSRDTQHHTPRNGTSRRKSSGDATLQAEVERLRDSITKMSEKYEHLHCRNAELEHDYRALKRNQERTRAKDAQQDLTQNVGHTQPNQPVHSSHSAPAQSTLRKDKDHLHPKLTQSRLLCVPPPKDRPHEPVRIYQDCRDRISDRQPGPIPIPVNLEDPRVTHMGPSPGPVRIPDEEGVGDSDSWEFYNSEAWPTYHTEAREDWEHSPAPVCPVPRPLAPETLPHADPAMRLLFEKVRRLKSEQHRSHQPLWVKPRPGPFTEHILHYHQEKDIQPLRIAFYTGTEDPLTHIHSFQSALGCKGLTDEGMCLFFPSTLSSAALNWFYRLHPRTINSFDNLKQMFLDHFMIQTDRLYSADDLYMLREAEDEPLREYAARFSHEYSRCPDTDDRAAFGAFKSGLCESNFRYLVHSNSWNTYTELMKQAAIHAKAEYFNSKHGPANLARNTFADLPPASAPALAPPQHSTPTPSTQGNQQPKRKDSYQHPFSNNKRGKHGNHHHSSGGNPPKTDDRAPLPLTPRPRFEVFTTLNTTYENVLVREAPIIPKPPPQRPSSKPMPNTGVFCRFHQFSGHDTESCVALRNIIEGLICEGKLDNYVHNIPPPPNPHQRQINMISTISGGPTLAGTSNNSIKHYVRSTYAHQVFSTEQGRLPKTQRSGWAPITFCEEEELGVILPHDDPLIIHADISNFDVGRILVDTGSSVSVMFANAFNELQVPSHLLDRSITPFVSFSGDVVQPIGSIHLPKSIGAAPQRMTITTPFLIVDCPTAYNVILGRPALAQMRAFISTHMLLLKFPTPNGPGTVRGDQLGARSCYASAVKSTNRQHRSEALAVTMAPAPPQAGTDPPEDPREESITQQAEPVEDLELVTLHDDIPDRQVRIGTSISPELRSDLVAFLRLNSEVFAWSYNDMPGISPDIISHRLSVNLAVRPVRQKHRAYDPERYEAMRAEVDRLSSIGFIKEVDYPTWLANVVMVRKPRKGWRMCVDYTNLNRACPKDSFPLPRIDQLVDATAGHALLSFMDAYSGYNQIFMHPEDQAHTSFITDRGLYCYKVMPFSLKNTGATYQRLVNHLFAPLIGNTMEVYVDDMLVKSRTADQHIPNLSAMFTILKQYNMRLNPTKCAFGVASGKFLGFMISQKGIEANPEKIQAILDMTIPKTVKDIQSLIGRVATLTRFISKATDRCAPFFKALKGTKRNITWTAECDTAFSELKEYMGRAPLLSTPEHGDILVIYLSISVSAVSSVLIRSKDNAEHPVHYVSKAFQDAEVRYPDIEKLAFALVVSARRLRPYFQAHTIHVLTNQPLRQVLQKPETSGRLVKWAIELGEFDIHYKPRPAIRGQAVADILSEFTEPQASAATQLLTEPNLPPSQDQTASKSTFDLTQPLWTLFVDGSSNAQGCGAGLVLVSPDKVALEYALRFKFQASNNEAEYEALLAGL